jgi:hypothetical protein
MGEGPVVIVERQARKKLEEITLRYLRDGRIPPASAVAREMAQFIRKADGGPTMRPRYQNPRTLWQFQTTNAVLKDISFDLEVLHDEAVEQFAKFLDRIGFIELSYLSQRQQLDSLLSLLKNLAFVSKNTEDNFFGVYDTFDDLAKIDLDKTTRDAVDLSEGCLVLPANDPTADRVDLSHLYSKQSWPIAVEAPDKPGSDTEPGTPAQIVQNEPVPNAWFGYAFADMVNAWRQVVTTGNNLGCLIEFTVPVSSLEDQTVEISRISMLPASTQTMEVTVLHSLDNVNYIKFPNLPEVTQVKTGRATNLDFETTRVRFVRFRVRIATPTEEDGASFHYIFGFRNLSFYKLGRAQDAEVYSKPLSAQAMTKPIDMVSMAVMEAIPANCDVSYFVAADDGTGSPRDGVWRPIQPITRAPIDGIPQVVRFGQSANTVKYLPAPETPVVHATVRGVDFYRLTEAQLDHEPLFGQAFLYRGENAWWRNTQRESVSRAAKDVFVDFNSGDVQKIYVTSTEVADLSEEVPPLGSQTTTVLVVENEVDYEPATMQLTPPSGVDPAVDQRPRYAVYQVLRFRDRMTITNEQVVLTGTAWSTLANAGLASKGTGRPVVKNNAESVTYIEGIDYVLEADSSTGRLTGRIKRLVTPSVTSNIADGDTVKVTYELDPDVTYLVGSIRENRIYLTRNLGTVADQYFQVTYRYVPIPPTSEVKKATVHVTSQYGSSEGDVYQEGRDYLVDTLKGTITRIPAGNIRGDLVAFVDFRYEQQPRDLDVFSGWFFVERRDPIVVEINPLDLDVRAGEVFLLDGVDCTQRTTLPEITYGWHKVTVRSRRPEAFTSAAITKIAELLDRNGDPVFVAGGPYFTRMTASRIPQLQRSYTQLTKATLKSDHGWFAIDGGHVIINFEPGSTEEVYTYGMRFVSGTLTADFWPEEFRLEYVYALETEDPVTKILTKVTLGRTSAANAGLTPKVHEYHIRLA